MATTAELEAQIQAVLDAQAINLGILFERDTDSRRTRLAYGSLWTDPDRKGTESSASKAVQTAAMLWHISQTPGLSLQTKVSDLVPEWLQQATGAQLDTRLWHCITMSAAVWYAVLPYPDATPAWATYESNVLGLLGLAANQAIAPGTEHHYHRGGLDTATLAIVRAKGAADWRTLFDAWRTTTGLFPSFAPEKSPSTTTFSMAGDIQCTLDDYMDFLLAIRDGSVLPAELRWQWLSDWIPGATLPQQVALLCAQYNKPIEDWRYTAGVWRESRESEPDSLSQDYSTVGLGGQKNSLKLKRGYRVCISRWPSGTANALSGVLLERELEPLLDEWAGLSD